jgi:hypothetical protein
MTERERQREKGARTNSVLLSRLGCNKAEARGKARQESIFGLGWFLYVRSAKRCRRYILYFMLSAYSRLESCKLDPQPLARKTWTDVEMSTALSSWVLASNRQTKSSRKYNTDISLPT